MGDDERRSERQFAVHFNTLTWDLLARTDRSPDDDLRMVHAAHASHMHWLVAGTPVHHQRGLWLIARVCAELGHGPEAMRYAKHCAALTEQRPEGLKPFDAFYSLEALARAHAVSGDLRAARELRERAEVATRELSDTATRSQVEVDINGGYWGELAP